MNSSDVYWVYNPLWHVLGNIGPNANKRRRDRAPSPAAISLIRDVLLSEKEPPTTKASAPMFFDELDTRAQPDIRPVPDDTQGFRIRLDLRYTKPPVWRRLVLPGDITLDRLHDVIQAAMGWEDCHLHRFRSDADLRSPAFITTWDVSQGDTGVWENEVRLDQIVSAVGDTIGYEYDFGDCWDHLLRVEEVLPEPPAEIELVTGRRACPPEDCGGVGGHDELAAWVESGHADSHLPPVFENAQQALEWLPDGWHPAAFDIEHARGLPDDLNNA
ncbi:MAG: plasmid pRiA4b ORF-3 family protein [Aeromicrobium sp.]|uniref:plasmid pRiA4b ORF-3 family protein n=1 Tax=Aeromicrobium sp. TaxID=1871063 RepID=UPI0039E25B9A